MAVSSTFWDQKSSIKFDIQIQCKTNNIILCPIKQLVSSILQKLNNIPYANEHTSLCPHYYDNKTELLLIFFIFQLLYYTVMDYSGKHTFSFTSDEIWICLLWWSTTMSLFLANHSVAKIMLLRCQSSNAFLMYTHPQFIK